VFSGCFIHTVDEKNRISLPARFREDLEDEVVVTAGPEGCLWVLQMEQWRLLLSRAAKSAEMQRFFVASAVRVVVGEKGRCLLSDSLRRHAGIKPGDEVVIVGLGGRIEIWTVSRWQDANSQISTEHVRRELPELFAVS
jgi:MraZ protein